MGYDSDSTDFPKSPEETVQLFADGKITEAKALQTLGMQAGGEANAMNAEGNKADPKCLERYAAFISQIEAHGAAKKEAKRTLGKMKLAAPIEALKAFECGKITREGIPASQRNERERNRRDNPQERWGVSYAS